MIQMYESPKGVPTPMNCVDMGESKPLSVRATQNHHSAQKVLDLAEKIYGELYSINKTDGANCDEPISTKNLDTTIGDTGYVLSVAESCLSEILYRLSGKN
jgi:hypothetical protein